MKITLKTSSYPKNRRNFSSLVSTSTKICKNVCLISAVIAILPSLNVNKISYNKGNKQGPK